MAPRQQVKKSRQGERVVDPRTYHQGRLKTAPADELVQTAHRLEVAYAAVLYKGLSLADLAHTVLLAETGIIPMPSAGRLLKVLLHVHNIPYEDFQFDPQYGDAYKNRERYILGLDPQVGGWLRTGRARREATNLAYQISVRERLLTLVESLGNLAGVLLDLAEKHIATIMPDFTYLQHAQPTSLAHYLLSFVYPIMRDVERIQACFQRVNQCSGGIGSVNGSRLPFKRQRLAELLGFDGVVTNTRDAMWQADMPVEIMSCVVAMSINLDRLCEDLQIWSTQEFDLVDLADAYSRESVIMPQKKNPYSLAFVRGSAGMMIGRWTSMANVGKTISGQPDNRIFAYGEVPCALDDANRMVRLVAGVMRTLTVHVNVMAQRTNEDYAQATDLAEILMISTGISYLDAHRIVGEVVRSAAEKGISAAGISSKMIEKVAFRLFGKRITFPTEHIRHALQPRQIVATRTCVGGAAAGPVRAMIEQSRISVAKSQRWRHKRATVLAKAESGLLKHARVLAKDRLG